MYERLNEGARELIAVALREALSSGSNYVGVEHIAAAFTRMMMPQMVAKLLAEFDKRLKNMESPATPEDLEQLAKALREIIRLQQALAE